MLLRPGEGEALSDMPANVAREAGVAQARREMSAAEIQRDLSVVIREVQRKIVKRGFLLSEVALRPLADVTEPNVMTQVRFVSRSKEGELEKTPTTPRHTVEDASVCSSSSSETYKRQDRKRRRSTEANYGDDRTVHRQ